MPTLSKSEETWEVAMDLGFVANGGQKKSTYIIYESIELINIEYYFQVQINK